MATDFALVDTLPLPPAWIREAACSPEATGLTEEELDALFYPERGQTTTTARQLCAECPVRLECLDYAIQVQQTFNDAGVWGGTSEKDRRIVRRARDFLARL